MERAYEREFDRQTDNIREIDYKVFLDLANVKEKVYKGVLVVKMKMTEPTEEVYSRYKGKVFNLLAATVDRKEEVWLFKLGKKVKEVDLLIGFSSIINSEHIGLFTYIDNANSYLVTQCEPMGVEEIFPRFNQPRKRVSFQIYILTFKYQDCESNTNKVKELKDECLDGGELTKDAFMAHVSDLIEFKCMSNLKFLKLNVFDKLINFPLHLVCFVVGQYKYYKASQIKKQDVDIRLLIPELGGAVKNKDMFELFYKTSMHSIDYYQSYLNEPFPFKKVYFVISNLPYNAMENPGLITVNSKNLQYFAKGELDYTVRNRMITHELAHMYFGYQVSIKTWKDMWLKESLAEFFCTKAFKHFVEKKIVVSEEEFIFMRLVNFLRIFKTDIISDDTMVYVGKEDSFYSLLSYYKGERMLGIVERVLGEKLNMEFWRDYLESFKGKSVCTKDFLSLFNKFVDKHKTKVKESLSRLLYFNSKQDVNVGQFFNNFFEEFITKKSYPIIKVEVNKTKVILTKPDSYKGGVFIKLTLYDKCFKAIKDVECIIYDKSTLCLGIDKELGAVIPNSTFLGYYLFQLDKTVRKCLINKKNIFKLNPHERWFIMANEALLAFSQKSKLDEDLLDCLEEEKHSYVGKYIRHYTNT